MASVHKASMSHDGFTYALMVEEDGSACIVEIDDDSNQLCLGRILDADEDGTDMGLAGYPREWFDEELAKGRGKILTKDIDDPRYE